MQFDPLSDYSLRNYAQVYSGSLLLDSSGWVLVGGSFVADSAYQFIVLGNHFDDAHTNAVAFGGTEQFAYYLIDDVCLSPDPSFCDLPEGITLNLTIGEPVIHPNPGVDVITVYCGRQDSFGVNVRNAVGEAVLLRSADGSDRISLDVSALPRGAYFVEVEGVDFVSSGKFILVE